MSAAGELLSSEFSYGGKLKNAKLAILKSRVVNRRYTGHGNTRKANLALMQAENKWYTNAEAKGKEGGKAFQSRRNFTRKLVAALARSPSPSPSGSRASSRASSRGSSRGSRASSRGLPVLAAAGANNAPKKTRGTRKVYSPPASGTWPLLKKSRQLWTVKVSPSKSREKATVSTLTGKEGGKLTAYSHNVIVGKAGRSPLQEALREAQKAYEEKKSTRGGYTEVRSVHRGTNNELKSINNFVPS